MNPGILSHWENKFLSGIANYVRKFHCITNGAESVQTAWESSHFKSNKA